MIAKAHHDKYAQYENPPEAIFPEDILSGTGIGLVLKNIYGDELPDHEPSKAFDARRSAGSLSGDKLAKAEAALASIGRYYGEVMAKLYGGDFTHMDPKAQWTAEDKQAVACYEAIVFGAGTSRATFFREIIEPAVRETLKEKGLEGKFELVFPENVAVVAEHAAAATVSKEALAVTPKALAELNTALGKPISITG